MVSSVGVELVSDDNVDRFVSKEGSKVVEALFWVIIALWIGQKTVLSVEVECPRHKT